MPSLFAAVALLCDVGLSAQQPTTAAASLEDVEQRLGPFEVGELRFTVVLHVKRVRGEQADPDWQTTLGALEIVDDAGRVHYRRTLPYELAGSQFTEPTSVTVESLVGKRGTGLLLTYGVIPSAPLGGQSWQVFGLAEGRLVPFGNPLSLDGDLVNRTARESSVRTTEEPRRDGDTLRFRVWTGNFFAVYSVLVDWPRAQLAPAWRCPRSCDYALEADRVPQEDELTFVRLYVEPDEGMGAPAHVVVEQDSAVELLECSGVVRWEQDERGIGLAPGDDFWIKVRIDGREGWIHTQEDLLAIGLPQAG